MEKAEKYLQEIEKIVKKWGKCEGYIHSWTSETKGNILVLVNVNFDFNKEDERIMNFYHSLITIFKEYELEISIKVTTYM